MKNSKLDRLISECVRKTIREFINEETGIQTYLFKYRKDDNADRVNFNLKKAFGDAVNIIEEDGISDDIYYIVSIKGNPDVYKRASDYIRRSDLDLVPSHEI